MEAETTLGEIFDSGPRFDEFETLVPFDHMRFLSHLHWSSQAQALQRIGGWRSPGSEIMFLSGDPGDEFCFKQTCLSVPRSFDIYFL